MNTNTLWDSLPNTIQRPDLENDLFWHTYAVMNPNVSVHVAIFSRPYLDLLLIAAKTVELRFAADRRDHTKKSMLVMYCCLSKLAVPYAELP